MKTNINSIFNLMQSTAEKNRMIAEFMGSEKIADAIDPCTYAYYVGNYIKNADNSENDNPANYFHPDDMKFKESWDWLMPVVETIDHCDALDSELISKIDSAIKTRVIGYVYNAVVRFIEHYKSILNAIDWWESHLIDADKEEIRLNIPFDDNGNPVDWSDLADMYRDEINEWLINK